MQMIVGYVQFGCDVDFYLLKDLYSILSLAVLSDLLVV